MSTVEKMNNKAILAQFLATICASISGIPNGMQGGWTAPVVPMLLKPDSPIKITESDIVWLESTIWIGAIIGLPLTIICVNKFGSKISTLIAAVQNLVAWALIAFAPSIGYLYASRAICGAANNNAFVSTPIYIAEIADSRIRGFLGTFTYITMLTGVIVVYSVAPFTSLPVSSLVGALFLVIQLITFPLMPDTPYHLLVQGKTEKARKALQWFRATDDVGSELNDISAAVERQKSERGRLIDLFVVKSNRKAIVIMTILNFTQHFSGMTVIVMNVHSILEDAVTLSPNIISIIFSVLMVSAAIGTSAVIDRAGRKFILGCSSFFTSLCLFTIAIYFTLKAYHVNVESVNWILIAAVMMYAIAFKCGIGIVPIVMTAEIFSTNIKAMGVAISDAMYVLFGFLSIILYQFLRQSYGIYVPFYIFGCCCLATGFFSMFYIPETKGRTLEEIQMLLKTSKRQVSYGLISNNDSDINKNSDDSIRNDNTQ